MKKSEMINILDEALLEYTDVGSSCCFLNINEKTLSKIIDKLEAAGMLPPERPDCSYYCECGNPDIIDQYNWEPEND